MLPEPRIVNSVSYLADTQKFQQTYASVNRCTEFRFMRQHPCYDVLACCVLFVVFSNSENVCGEELLSFVKASHKMLILVQYSCTAL